MADNKPPAAGRGRPKGALNKTTKQLKDMILEALDKAGGVDYLVTQSRDNPTAFLTLAGKVLPLQVNADIAGKMVTEVAHRIIDRT